MNWDAERMVEIFAEALELVCPEDRAGFLDRACRGEPGLREQVESLLRAHDQAGDFLRRPGRNGETGI